MTEFIQEAQHSLENLKSLNALQEHEAAAMTLKVMAAAFLLEAERQIRKHAQLQAYLDL